MAEDETFCANSPPAGVGVHDQPGKSKPDDHGQTPEVSTRAGDAKGSRQRHECSEAAEATLCSRREWCGMNLRHGESRYSISIRFSNLNNKDTT